MFLITRYKNVIYIAVVKVAMAKATSKRTDTNEKKKKTIQTNNNKYRNKNNLKTEYYILSEASIHNVNIEGKKHTENNQKM